MKRIFKFTGHKMKDGKYILSDSGCSTCGGRGYVGRDIKRNILIPCPRKGCLKITEFPIAHIKL